MTRSDADISVIIKAFTSKPTESTTFSTISDRSSKMDSLEAVTYLIAALGVIVLGLCITVACLLIYQYCRKLKGQDYTQVHSEENGVVPKSYVPRKKSTPDFQENNFETIDEVDRKGSKKIFNNFASVKTHLFRKNSKAKRKSTIEFDANDFDVPMPAVNRPKRVAFNPRISRSDWDIYDNRSGGEMREELEMLLSRNSKDLSIRSKSPDTEADFKSQYFDALETLSEDEEGNDVTQMTMLQDEVAENSDDDFIDIESENESNEDRKDYRKTLKPKVIDLKLQPIAVQRRVKALKRLLVEQKKVESEMFKDIHKLEGYFYKIHQNKNYNERLKHIEGELNQSTIIEEDENAEVPHEEMQQQGIPGFWLRVLLNSKNLSQIVQAADVPVLNNLVDVRVFNFENPIGFRLVFVFKPNEHFIDSELTKDYFLKCEPGEDDNPLHFEGPEVIGCQGCKIHWKKHKNLTLKPIKKVQNHKIVTKWARKNSFFNFFTPPKMSGSNEDMHHLKRRELLEAHFQLGLFFKEQIIPKAYLFFTRTGYDSEMQRAGSKVKLKRSSRMISTSSGHKTPVLRRVSAEDKETKVIQNSNHSISEPTSLTKNVQDISKPTMNGNAINHEPPEANNVIHKQVTQMNDNTDIVESVVNEIKDPLPGRYLMETSDNFDDFMKALGVGLIKRKLANSVIPINEIEIADNGIYTIRTVTTVRTSEISFKLNEPFTEDTIDGRKTQTVATRVGNFLKLDQKGDKSRGEKDSLMTRDLVGNVITMELIVDNITCTRIYKRIEE